MAWIRMGGGSGKPKNFVVYDNGTQYIGLTGTDITFQSTNISVKQNGTIRPTTTIDLSNYTYISVTTNFGIVTLNVSTLGTTTFVFDKPYSTIRLQAGGLSATKDAVGSNCTVTKIELHN